jgi:hypothetical protein
MNDRAANTLRYLRKNFDELAIVTACAHLMHVPALLNSTDLQVLGAIRRISPTLGNMSLEDLGSYLRQMDDHQIGGFINNVKGVLHEMEYVEMVNDSGGHVHATLYDDPHHPDMDVVFDDQTNGHEWDAQLKATDDAHYVQDWVDHHPGGEILVTDELAHAHGFESSGLSNHQLTAQTDDFVHKALALEHPESLWHSMPIITPIAAGLAVWKLYQRYQRGEISYQRFKRLAMLTTGLKATKLVVLTALLSVPGLNVVVGSLLVAKLILAADSALHLLPSPKGRASA